MDALRNWVLLPITVVMILVGVLRNNILKLIEGRPKPVALAKLRQQNVLQRTGALRKNFRAIPPASVERRCEFFSRVLADGSYLEPEVRAAIERERKRGPNDPIEPPKNPLTDPDAMESMLEPMKRSMVMMIPQTVIMGWVNFFFSGFVLIKLPFPLTQAFKVMLQRDVDTSDLDVSWVSSLSWYFLNLYGLDAIYRLILGNNNAADSSRDMAAMGGAVGMMPQQPQMPGQEPQASKLQSSERENLALIKPQLNAAGPRWVGDSVEARVLAMYA
ncbi:hypothetical protein MCUN1_001753 [Malassezia cuniculi]|uniref:ER membrane protein complex subunit 3 n=1 Tax=Malassezia cuniculi TaxID=948313 RepID=A0AAF0EQC5_9BASI|nr:hypothetical protein MCUN1_001753 [Malassezia cuniculi]